MAIYDLTVSLDLKQNLNIYATCKQLDSINLICSIYDNSVQADLTNYIVRLKAMKADSIPLIQEYTGVSIPANSNVVTIAANEQLTTTAGEIPIELQFIDKTSGKKKATFNLILEVMSSTLVVDRSISTATYTLLEELENKLDQTSDFFENISEAVEINNELKTSIASGSTLKTGLDTDVVNGNALKTGLENSTVAASTAKSNLDNSISNANTAKSAVDASNTNAQATKSDLEADIAQAKSNSFATEITNARGTYANLKARFDANDTSLSEMVKKSRADITYYVDVVNGNDTNNGFGSGVAFKTIQQAIDILPQIINHTVTINVASGTYDESININGFVGYGKIIINGDTIVSTTRKIKNININSCECYLKIVGFYIITTSGTHDIAVDNSSRTNLLYVNCIEPNSASGLRALFSNVFVSNSVISNKAAAIDTWILGNIFSSINSGSSNTVALQSGYGGTISKQSSQQPTGITSESSFYGGVIR